MSGRIHFCPSCGTVGLKTDLTDRQVSDLAHTLLHPRLNREAWDVRGFWCPHCERFYLVVWPISLSREACREILAGPDAPLLIDEGGGG